ncbi:MAG: glutathione-disulfide reductase [Sphingomonadaceae bacterium]
MARFDFDLFTIGGGSGGVRASRFAAQYGARVAIAESDRFGGTCVNVGCIPKKLFSYAAHFRDDLEDARGYGWSVGEPAFDWPKLVAGKDKEVARLNAVYERLLATAGAEILRGRAVIVDPHTVEVAGRRWSAEHILVATGSRPQIPDIPGKSLALTSDDIFRLERLPPRAIVVGGGYIAVEFASIFNGLGVRTTLAYRRHRLLREFDAELGTRLGEEIQKKGVMLHFGAEPVAIERQPDGALEVTYGDGQHARAELVLFATGRVPNSKGLGLEAAGVKLGPIDEVLVDAYSRSSVESIHAIGDVTNRINLTPVATAEGGALAKTLFGGQPTAPDHENVPTAVFANPNLATVGLSEEQARERHGAIEIYKTSFRSLKHALTAGEEKIFMKLVVETASGRVLGAHMIGPEAAEIIQGIAIAVKLGATKAQFDATLGIHPTAAEEFVTLREPVVS